MNLSEAVRRVLLDEIVSKQDERGAYIEFDEIVVSPRAMVHEKEVSFRQRGKHVASISVSIDWVTGVLHISGIEGRFRPTIE